jgi:hypothetical protein
MSVAAQRLMNRLSLRGDSAFTFLLLPALLQDARGRLGQKIASLDRAVATMSAQASLAADRLHGVLDEIAAAIDEEISLDPRRQYPMTYDWLAKEDEFSRYVRNWDQIIGGLDRTSQLLRSAEYALDEPEAAIETWLARLSNDNRTSDRLYRFRDHIEPQLHIREALRNLEASKPAIYQSGHRQLVALLAVTIDRLQTAVEASDLLDDYHRIPGMQVPLGSLSVARYLIGLASRISEHGPSSEVTRTLLWADAMVGVTIGARMEIANLPVAEIRTGPVSDFLSNPSFFENGVDVVHAIESSVENLQKGRDAVISASQAIILDFRRYVDSDDVYESVAVAA